MPTTKLLRPNRRVLSVFLSLAVLCTCNLAAAKDGNHKTRKQVSDGENAVLWQDPGNIRSRNLLYGPGGKKHEPRGTFTFVKEDMEGSNTKFDVKDEDGVKWKVKLGEESRPETVASRFIWAVGYFANEYYFRPAIQVQDMPAHLQRKRARKQDFSSGLIANARLKREPKGEKKIGYWKWRDNPFIGTREFNGLRVMMGVINNWDLKDVNNAVYEEKDGDERDGNDSARPRIYMISDLGATFGTSGVQRYNWIDKGNVNSYSRSRFIRKATPDYIDFEVPSRSLFLVRMALFYLRIHIHKVGRHVPRADAKWMGQQLARLSPEQIRDAFRAADYTPDEVERFSKVIEGRIGELNEL